MNMIRIPLIAVIAIAAIVGAMSVYTVDERQHALIMQFGEIKKVAPGSGLGFKLPWQNVIYLEKRILRLDVPEREFLSKDKKSVLVDAVVRYRIVDPLQFFQRVRSEIGVESRLEPIFNGSLRDVVGQNDFLDLLSLKRTEMMGQIAVSVNNASADLGMEIVDVRIRRTDLPQQNSQAVIKRMITERQQEAAKWRAEGRRDAKEITSKAERTRVEILAEAGRKSEILRGEGEGERNKVFANAFQQDPEFFNFYRSMQAYRTAIDQDDTTLVLSPDSEFFKFFGDEKGN